MKLFFVFSMMNKKNEVPMNTKTQKTQAWVLYTQSSSLVVMV